MNRIVRVCAEKPDSFKKIAITKAIIVVYINDKKNYAYGAGLKYQGGGTWGDYHIIGLKNKLNSRWTFNVGNFQPFDGFHEEISVTASRFSTFNINEAIKYFESDDEQSMYKCYSKFNRDVWDEQIRNNCNKYEFKALGFNKNEQTDIDEDSDYYSSKLCIINELTGYKKRNGYLWYYENLCCNNILKQFQENDSISKISKMIPGNIDFHN